jgi:ribosomal protein S18 acetylase RimI-like enzyme
MIRRAESSDVAAIARLLVQVQDQHVADYPAIFHAMSVAQAEAEITSHVASGFYAVHEDAVISGFVKWLVHDRPESSFTKAVRIVQIDQIAVDHGHRRQGIGQQLLAWVCERARESGAQRVQLDAWEANIAAQAAFRKSGFETYHHRLCKML